LAGDPRPAGKFPNRGLLYPKSDEKPPFMTMAEIDMQLAADGDPDTLWECLLNWPSYSPT
jgi:hypothetical protein